MSLFSKFTVMGGTVGQEGGNWKKAPARQSPLHDGRRGWEIDQCGGLRRS